MRRAYPLAITSALIVLAFFVGTMMGPWNVHAAPPVQSPAQSPTADQYVTTGRPANLTTDPDGKIWIKLPDGTPTTATFNEPGFVTAWFGKDVYLFHADAGKQITDVVSFTFRPDSGGWTWSYADFVAFEKNYHETVNPACVRDADNGDSAVTNLCQ